MSEPLNMKKAQVLLVDDSTAVSDLIVQILLAFGVSHITCSASGKEAQARCQDVAYDLILCDSDMPDMNGYELISWLRTESGQLNARTAVIILSGHASARNVGRARDSGANFTIAKPVSPTVLLQKIRWVTRDTRSFIEASNYCGPDRRNRIRYPNPGRRAGDDAAISPNLAGVELSQSGIDDLFN